MIIVGITGTLGAGKGEVVSCLKKYGFSHFSARDFLMGEMVKRQIPINRVSMTDVADDLRKTHSPSYIIERLFAAALVKGQNAILESVRTPGEVDFLKKQAIVNGKRFYLIAVDADQKVRYDRIVGRASQLDKGVSFEAFLSDEAREMKSTDPAKGNIAQCMRLADFTIRNDGDREHLAAQVEKIVSQIVPK